MTFAAARNRLTQNPWLRRIGLRVCEYGRDLPRSVRFQQIPFLQRWSGRPVGWHRSVGDYLGLHPGRGWEKAIRPSGSYERVAPIPLDPPLPSCFNPPQTVSWKDERVIALEGSRYWGGYGGAIIAHDEYLVGELSPDVWGVERHAMFNKVKLPALAPLPGLSAIVSTPEANTNYSHWLMDLLPRLDLLACAGFGPDKVDRYLVNLGGAPYERETLALAGIPAEKIFPVDEASHFRCERIVTTSIRTEHWQHALPSWVPNYLRNLVDVTTAPNTSARRLYLTRENALFRKVLNEAQLRPILEKHGFAVIDPGTLSVREQAKLFANAGVIVSPHSSALTNLVFCPPGVTVLEIFPADYFDVSFWTAATMAGCHYHAVVGGRPGADVPRTMIEGRRQDIIAPAGMETILTNLLCRQS